MFPNKKFQSNETHEVVTVTNDTGVFYSLSNGANIKKDIFFQKYSEMLDASNFFQQQSAAGLADLASQLKSVDPNQVRDDGASAAPRVKVLQESVSEQVAAPSEYKEMLLRRFEAEQAHKDLSQYKVYDNEDDAAADFERRLKQPPPPKPVKSLRQQQEEDQYNNNYVQPQETGGYVPSQITQPQQPQQPVYSDPEMEAFRFFKSFKRIYPIKLSIDFDERIAEPNFIKMMVTNFEGDIIKYYTKEIMNRVQNDPGFLENKIYDRLRAIVFEEDQKKPRAPRAPKAKKVEPKKPVKKKVRSIPDFEFTPPPPKKKNESSEEM